MLLNKRIDEIVRKLLVIPNTELISQAQGQRFNTVRCINFCTPHTNKIDSPSILTWANLGAPVKSDINISDIGAPQIYEIIRSLYETNNNTNYD